MQDGNVVLYHDSVSWYFFIRSVPGMFNNKEFMGDTLRQFSWGSFIFWDIPKDGAFQNIQFRFKRIPECVSVSHAIKKYFEYQRILCTPS